LNSIGGTRPSTPGNGIIAILLPYASESYPIKIRGRATGWVAMFTKGGGVLAQSLSIAALVPPLGVTAVIIMDLRHLEGGMRVPAATKFVPSPSECI